jgi:WD40 repeat protein
MASDKKAPMMKQIQSFTLFCLLVVSPIFVHAFDTVELLPPNEPQGVAWPWLKGEWPPLSPGLGSVAALAFSPDGTTLASVGSSQRLRLWDTASGAALASVHEYGHSLTGVAYSPDGHWLAFAGDSYIAIWDAARRQIAQRLPIGAIQVPIHSLAFSPDSSLLAAQSDRQSLGLWRVEDGRQLHDFELSDKTSPSIRIPGTRMALTRPVVTRAKELAFSPDGQRLVAGLGNGTILVWRLAPYQREAEWRLHKREVTGLGFSADSRHLYSSALDSALYVWDMRTLEHLKTLEDPIQPKTREEVWQLNTPRHMQVRGDTLYIHRWKEELERRDSNGGNKHSVQSEPGESMRAFALSQDATQYARGSRNYSIYLHDSSTGKLLRRFGGHAHQLLAQAVSADGRRLATFSQNLHLTLWDLESKRPLRQFIHDSLIYKLLFDNAADTLMLVSYRELGRRFSNLKPEAIWLWQLDRPEPERLVDLTKQAAGHSFAFSGDGQSVAFTVKGETQLVSRNGQIEQRLKTEDKVTALAFSPDSQTLVTALGNIMVFWQRADGSEGKILKTYGDNNVTRLAFDNSGAYLLAQTSKTEYYVWRLDNGDNIFELSSNMGGSAVFTGSGSELAVLSKHAIEIYRPPVIQAARRFNTAETKLTGLSASQDTLISYTENGLLQAWPLDNTESAWLFAGGSHGVWFACQWQKRCWQGDDGSLWEKAQAN